MPQKQLLQGNLGMAITFTSELIVVGTGAYLSYASIGTPLSNAKGTVIRSTVTSGLYSFIMVIGVGLFGLDLSARLVLKKTPALKYMLMSGLVVAAALLIPLIYYNFYYSYTAIIGGTAYTVFPYAVQPGIPFMLALLLSFIAGIQMISQRSNRKRFKLRGGPVVRISREGVEFSAVSNKTGQEKK